MFSTRMRHSGRLPHALAWSKQAGKRLFWRSKRAYNALLSLPTNADPALQHLELELDRVAAEAEPDVHPNGEA